MKYEGSCHCGNVSYEVEGDIESLMECNCSICAKRGYLLWFVPRDQVNLKTPESNMKTYTFNKHRVNHNFCTKCCCAALSFGLDDKGNEIAAINARCMTDIDLTQFEIIQFDGKSL